MIIIDNSLTVTHLVFLLSFPLVNDYMVTSNISNQRMVLMHFEIACYIPKVSLYLLFLYLRFKECFVEMFNYS